MKNNLSTKLLLSAALIALSPTAFAADQHNHGHSHDHHSEHKTTSPFYGHLDVKIHADSILDAEEAEEEFDEFYTHSHLELGVRLGENFSINTNIKLEGEPSGHAHGGDSAPDGSDRFFEDHPLIIEQLTLNYDNDYISAYIGKFNPIVGFDYHEFPGVYSYQTIEEYSIRERVGVGGALKHDMGQLGQHRLDASTFFADTTTLSDSLLSQRGHTSEEDGGLSNTEDFSSHAVSLGGSGIYAETPDVNGLSYRIGYAEQATGIDNDEDETRFSFSLGYERQLTDSLKLKLITEYVDIEHLDGEEDHDRALATAAIRFDYHQWNLSGSYTDINNDASDLEEGQDGDILQVSAGYSFSNGITIDVGYQTSDQEGEVTDRVGALIGYSYNF